MLNTVLIRRAALLLALVVLAFSMVMPAAAQGLGYGTIANASRVNIRSGPGAGFPVVTVVSAGHQLVLLSRNADNSWIQVQLYGSGATGWVNARYVAPSVPFDSLGVSQPTGSSNAMINTSYLNIRSGPGANFTDLGTLAQGSAVNIIGRNADTTWVQINIPGGVQGGWISARYIAASVYLGSLPVTSNTGITPNFPQPVPLGGQTGLVTAGNLNVRYGPSAWFGAFDRLSNGQGVSLIGRNGNASWLLVQLVNGTTGWVSSAYIRTSYPVWSLPISG